MEEEIFKISINPIRAKSLKELALDRFSDIKNEKKPYKIIEEYYEVIKELITALMYNNGLKTLSHKTLIYYLEKNYKEFTKQEILLIDDLRKLRNDIVYYGKKTVEDFLINHESQIKIIIDKLIKITSDKILWINYSINLKIY